MEIGQLGGKISKRMDENEVWLWNEWLMKHQSITCSLKPKICCFKKSMKH